MKKLVLFREVLFFLIYSVYCDIKKSFHDLTQLQQKVSQNASKGKISYKYIFLYKKYSTCVDLDKIARAVDD